MDVFMFALGKSVYLVYAVFGSICGLLTFVPSAWNTFTEVIDDPGRLFREGSSALASIFDTYRPSETLERFAAWLGWDQLGSTARSIGAWFAVDSRAEAITIVSVIMILLAVGVFAYFRQQDELVWQPLTAGVIAAAALAEVGLPVWAVALAVVSAVLVLMILTGVIGLFMDPPESLHGFTTFWVVLIVSTALVTAAAPLAAGFGLYSPGRARRR